MPARDERGDRVGLLDAPFELDGLAARFLQDAAGVFDRPVRAEVKTRERHVDDHQRVLDRAADHFGVVDHLVERDGQRAVVALDDHRHAVADENALDAGRIDQPRERVVVGRDHRDLTPGRFEAGELGDGNSLGCHAGGSSLRWKRDRDDRSRFLLWPVRQRLTTRINGPVQNEPAMGGRGQLGVD